MASPPESGWRHSPTDHSVGSGRKNQKGQGHPLRSERSDATRRTHHPGIIVHGTVDSTVDGTGSCSKNVLVTQSSSTMLHTVRS